MVYYSRKTGRGCPGPIPPSARALPGRKERDTMPYDKELITHKLIRWEEYLNHYKLPAWKELPDIGLYMDQLISYMPRQLIHYGEGESLTSAMVNNYIKDGPS